MHRDKDSSHEIRQKITKLALDRVESEVINFNSIPSVRYIILDAFEHLLSKRT